MTDTLSKQDIELFITNGFIKIEQAFSSELAVEVVNRLWKDIPFDRSDSSTWTEPVVRLGMYTEPAFQESINTPKLHSAFDQLVGINNWIPCQSVGTFPVRFPSDKRPNDAGKHVDVSFPGENPTNYLEWCSNIMSKGRALLLLILYSDVSELDAPTVIYKGSHIDIAKLLADKGEDGLSFMEIAGRLDELPKREELYATGKAGTVYLCHPFLVHSAQGHRGSLPKFMAQPPLLFRNKLTALDLELAPVERAIRLGMN